MGPRRVVGNRSTSGTPSSYPKDNVKSPPSSAKSEFGDRVGGQLNRMEQRELVAHDAGGGGAVSSHPGAGARSPSVGLNISDVVKFISNTDQSPQQTNSGGLLPSSPACPVVAPTPSAQPCADGNIGIQEGRAQELSSAQRSPLRTFATRKQQKQHPSVHTADPVVRTVVTSSNSIRSHPPQQSDTTVKALNLSQPVSSCLGFSSENALDYGSQTSAVQSLQGQPITASADGAVHWVDVEPGKDRIEWLQVLSLGQEPKDAQSQLSADNNPSNIASPLQEGVFYDEGRRGLFSQTSVASLTNTATRNSRIKSSSRDSQSNSDHHLGQAKSTETNGNIVTTGSEDDSVISVSGATTSLAIWASSFSNCSTNASNPPSAKSLGFSDHDGVKNLVGDCAMAFSFCSQCPSDEDTTGQPTSV